MSREWLGNQSGLTHTRAHARRVALETGDRRHEQKRRATQFCGVDSNQSQIDEALSVNAAEIGFGS